MYQEKYNNTIFYSISCIEIAKEIQSFYRNHNIDLKIISITSYFNFKSYTFVSNDLIQLDYIEDLASDLVTHLKLKVIRVISKENKYISFELHNKNWKAYDFFTAIEDEKFQNPQEIHLPILLGERNGNFIIDLHKTPHLLIGGRIGGGKSVFINILLLSLLYHHSPETLKLVLIDPTVVELSIYNDIPHLLYPVITDQRYINPVLTWCVDEVEKRYQLLSKSQVRNIIQYNDKVETDEKLPYIVIVIEEFANIMLSAYKNEFQKLICRLTQKARATGIHLVMATQRSDVTDVIKDYIPSRIAFIVSGKLDSRTILDNKGAECLCGKGDFLFRDCRNTNELIRLQSPYLDDGSIYRITENLRKQGKPNYIDLSKYLPPKEEIKYSDNELDPLFDEVVEYILDTGVTSASGLQRRFSIGFSRAGRIVDQLEEQGILSAPDKRKQREVLISR